MTTLHIEGTVEEIIFKSETTGYTVLDLDAGGELITVVGEIGDTDIGEGLILEGNYETHTKFGTQFKAEYCEKKLPSTAVNIEKYLSSGVIKGIGPSLARKIVKVFGDETLDIIENRTYRLCEIKGISKKKCNEIAEEAKQLFALRHLTAYLLQYDIKPKFSVMAYKKFGTDTEKLIKKNPYLLCGESIGLDFRKADKIADSVGIEHNSDNRIIAGIQYILKANADTGHSCLPVEKLSELTKKFLEISDEDLNNSLKYAFSENELIPYEKNNKKFIYFPDYYYAEKFIADRIHILKEFSPPEDYNFNAMIDIEEEENNIKYGDLQRKAICSAVSQGISIITGGPGTGKTTALNAIISILEKKGERILLAAPTGRAAKRMSDLTDREARTIHRLLEMVYDKDGKLVFAHNENNPIDCDVLIVDEMSMVDVLLFESLLRALRLKCKLIMVGDGDQLPSVGAGNLLNDMINSGIIPTVRLKEIFRQARQSCIITNAHKIVSGEYPELEVKDNDFFFFQRNDYGQAVQLIVDLVKTRLPKAFEYSPTEDIQILTPSRKGSTGAVELNKILQQELNPPAKIKPEFKGFVYTYRQGDKVMQTKNNYDIKWKKDDEKGAGIFNGDIGRIIKMDRFSGIATIDFDGRIADYPYEMLSQIDLAYAITVHKSQGCEFEAVIMPVMEGFEKLSYRNLLYTAVTRAKKLMILVGSEKKIYKMVDNNRKTVRCTCLEHMLNNNSEL